MSRVEPWSRMIPHASGQVSLSAAATGSVRPKAHALQREKPLQRDALTLPLGSRPWSLQLEEACSQQQRPSVAKYGFPGGAGGKEPACQCRRCKRHGFDPWVGKTPWRRA